MQHPVSKFVFRGLQLTGVVLVVAGLIYTNGIVVGCGLFAMVAAWLVVKNMNDWDG